MRVTFRSTLAPGNYASRDSYLCLSELPYYSCAGNGSIVFAFTGT